MTENSLTLLTDANRLLAQVRNSQDAKKLMDMAAAAALYARKAKMGQQAIDHAFAIKIDAERLLGQFLKQTDRADGGDAQRTRLHGNTESPPTLGSLGITKRESVESQLLSTIADSDERLFNAIREGQKSIAEVRREIKKKELSKNLKELPSDKYRVIYADPPWSYNDKCDEGSIQTGGAERHYPSLSLTDLCALPIADLSDENAVLFLWTTTPLLFDAEEVFRAWGFDYKTCFIWDKVRHNMGHYSSVRHEILLLCTRGSCTPDVSKLFDSVQSIEKTTKHSEKPEEFRQIIDTLYPTGKRIELFARKQTPNWQTWGNENV